MQCELKYIPDDLKTLDKPLIETFSIGELLYFRCKSEALENPYKSISVAELSHNRSGEDNCISHEEDVLYNIAADKDFEKHDLEVCTLRIVHLNEESKYHKEFPDDPNAKTASKATMALVHEPEPCMYPHCVFRIHLDGVMVTMKNYKTTLNNSHEIRSMIKHELYKMILRREVSQE